MYILSEMQNPDITEPAGAGDVPTANYKMIGALAVKKGQLEKAKLPEFFKQAWIHRVCTNSRTYSFRSSIDRILQDEHNYLKEK